MTIDILPERAKDGPDIEALLDRTFGPDRQAKTVYRLRKGVAPLPELCFVVPGPDEALLAALRFWPVRIAGTPAILLGPLAVEPRLQGQGFGRALLRHAMTQAKRLGHRISIVVGAPDYYAPYGFARDLATRLVLPGPVDPRRFLAAELTPGAHEELSGPVGRAEAAPRRSLRPDQVA